MAVHRPKGVRLRLRETATLSGFFLEVLARLLNSHRSSSTSLDTLGVRYNSGGVTPSVTASDSTAAALTRYTYAGGKGDVVVVVVVVEGLSSFDSRRIFSHH